MEGLTPDNCYSLSLLQQLRVVGSKSRWKSRLEAGLEVNLLPQPLEYWDRHVSESLARESRLEP